MLFPGRTDRTELLLKAVTKAVQLRLTPLCRTAFYTVAVHRCFKKSDAFIISLVPMVTKMDVSLWKILLFVWFRQQLKSTLSARVANSQRKDEVNANIACDLFVGFCDRCMKKVNPLTFHAHALFH